MSRCFSAVIEFGDGMLNLARAGNELAGGLPDPDVSGTVAEIDTAIYGMDFAWYAARS